MQKKQARVKAKPRARKLTLEERVKLLEEQVVGLRILLVASAGASLFSAIQSGVGAASLAKQLAGGQPSPTAGGAGPGREAPASGGGLR